MPAPTFSVRSRRAARGFTLIELMITVAIIGILARIALPAYMGYTLRASIQEGLQGLSADRVKMEQYFMDNRDYANPTSATAVCGSGAPGAGQTISEPTAGKFNITCTPSAPTGSGHPYNGYTITATGTGSVAGFVYTIDQSNNMTSAISKAGWPASCSNWASRPGVCVP